MAFTSKRLPLALFTTEGACLQKRSQTQAKKEEGNCQRNLLQIWKIKERKAMGRRPQRL